jgi:hypothetical protein
MNELYIQDYQDKQNSRVLTKKFADVWKGFR